MNYRDIFKSSKVVIYENKLTAFDGHKAKIHILPESFDGPDNQRVTPILAILPTFVLLSFDDFNSFDFQIVTNKSSKSQRNGTNRKPLIF